MPTDLRERLRALVERLWTSYERALEADGDDGCEHTPDGDPLVCWACRKRRFELVAEPVLSELLVARCVHGREKCWACDQVAEANRLGAEEVAAILAESEPVDWSKPHDIVVTVTHSPHGPGNCADCADDEVRREREAEAAGTRAVVRINAADVAAVFGHRCDSATCPACQPRSAHEPKP